MTCEFPEPIQNRLHALCVEKRRVAFVRMDRRGCAVAWGGPVEHYGLDGLSMGRPVASLCPALEGVLPLRGVSVVFPFVHVMPDVCADIHLLAGEREDWALLLDASEEAQRLFEIQQNSNEVALLRDREAKMLEEISRSHAHLLSIFDQLQFITAIVDGNGRVEFLSQTGRRFFLKQGQDAIALPWEQVFPFSREDQATVRDLLAAKADQRRKVRIHAQVPSGKICWLEVDVRDDPRDSRKRIVFLYDISEIHDLRQLLKDKARFCDIVGKSGPMEQVFQLIRDVAKYDATVLIEGETGTGKELVARAIHASSNRRDGPFIVMNCAGLSDTLINSQLFGHKKGAFTDAIRDQEGLFEAANNGTIVLDEIGDIPLNTQTRILRVLEQREIVRIGETQPRTINIRILAATNKDLAAEVSKGNFRLDLLYRIRVARIRLPPLRERREDIPLLTASFLSQFRVAAGKSVETVDEEAMRLFLSYRWPGNVRELRNAIEFAVIRCRGSTIKVEDLPPEITDVQLAVQGARSYEVNEEKERIRKALDACSGRRAEAAKLLGVSRATLYRRMRACFLADRDSDKTRA